ncbi:hypothetical protein EET67_09695 [Pseudaminobacter arsenicus]|uniref:Uncharacterized protein n=2 Tax=Borborobacter arsenicus TaxID=1851146 RepID=A0A432V7E8_9HYPH|nr:hypothetical protein EET67_09695 [Pseudaminobacter arsenicus]
MDRIDHALGRPIWPLRETYRNHYATDATGALAIDLAYSAHWESLGQSGSMAFFAVTVTGRKALADYLDSMDATQRHRAYLVTYEGHSRIVPAKSRANARYSEFLTIRDCFSELTFGEFIRASSVRQA